MDWSNQLGLSFSPTGRVVYSLSASVEQARSCLAQAPEIYDALGVFGEALGPEMPEEDSLQTPSSLLIELAELILGRLVILNDFDTSLAISCGSYRNIM